MLRAWDKLKDFGIFSFSSAPFLGRRSLGFLDCFTGQSPGIGRNELAISIPVPPALRGSWPELLDEGLGGGWARGVGRGPRPTVGSREDHSFQH